MLDDHSVPSLVSEVEERGPYGLVQNVFKDETPTTLRPVKLTSDDKKIIDALMKNRTAELEEQNVLIRLCFVLCLKANPEDKETFADKLKKCLSKQDPLTTCSKTSPVGLIKTQLFDLFMDENAFELNSLEKDVNFTVPVDTWQKEGLVLTVDDEGNPNISIHGHSYRVDLNANEIIVQEQFALSPKLTKTMKESHVTGKVGFIGARLIKIVENLRFVNEAAEEKVIGPAHLWSVRILIPRPIEEITGENEKGKNSKRKRTSIKTSVATLKTCGFLAFDLDLHDCLILPEEGEDRDESYLKSLDQGGGQVTVFNEGNSDADKIRSAAQKAYSELSTKFDTVSQKIAQIERKPNRTARQDETLKTYKVHKVAYEVEMDKLRSMVSNG